MDRKLLIVDDSPDIVEMLSDHFGERGYRVDSAQSGTQALNFLNQEYFDGIVLLDFKLPDVDGLELLEQIGVLAPGAGVIMITAHGSIGMAMEAITRKGAFFVHSKAEDSFLERLAATVNNAFQRLNLERKLKSLEDEMGSRFSFSGIITQSREMTALIRTLQQVVDSKVAVAIQGESGTGKELVAKAIHYNGPRRNQPFVAINCAGIPDTLLESELFGYEKGAFTGAVTRKQGKFEQAHKGTLFLDEIGEMDLALQAKILRVLQEKSFERLGGSQTVSVDVRILSATNKVLEDEVKKGTFREDLFYRLSVFPVHLPPLRKRKEDIPILGQHFLRRFASDEGKQIEGFSQSVVDRLMAYDYPGNVRQLENIVSHAVVVCGGKTIEITDLPPYLKGGQSDTAVPPVLGNMGREELFPENEVIPIKELEERAIQHALKVCKGNVSLAAKRLGLSRATIYRKLNEDGEA